MKAAHVASDPRLASRLKLAELTSILGAGLLLHAWGMRDKHALEAGAPQPAWSAALYWACWLILGALALYAIARVVIGS